MPAFWRFRALPAGWRGARDPGLKAGTDRPLHALCDPQAQAAGAHGRLPRPGRAQAGGLPRRLTPRSGGPTVELAHELVEDALEIAHLALASRRSSVGLARRYSRRAHSSPRRAATTPKAK